MKILVIYATAGAGHKMAAQALYSRLKTLPGIDAVFVDALEHTNRFYKHLYSRSYTLLITKAPGLWGFFFWLLDIPWLQPLVRLVRRAQNSLQAWRLSRFLEKENFDYILSTHFFPNEVAGYLKRKGKITSKIICAVTDFDVHRIWLASGIDRYTVASEWTKRKILKLGVPQEQVVVTGIPIDEKFSRPRDMAVLKQKLGIKENVFTVLVATGSFGIGPIEEIMEELIGFQVLVVCGHNKALYERLSQKQKGLVKIYGLVNNMDELMAVSQAMVTKPGGLSISEALVSGLPMIFFNAIPGQETNNIKVLKEQGVGISDCSIPDIGRQLRRFQTSPEEFQAAQQKVRDLARPFAVRDIVALVK
jgi:processive 1,2-diacylglycerol beta-glucosyltransferase